ncbi:hypothetical protein [Psychrobacillus lasiicapitis]|uniref:Uncharacterized protein n=1 Tax=Psychrobacillus lasiicapitis TaxID=1636719 RepID=A0A544TAL6_9BACI|nr:hypothetical protein [Psychrobacillus lasiicapitis]TQR14479.1 hypothetical protein FG382_08465 [Psychrobacillus lasiicapitis]GGA30983.1 hypothetical protein GCM10011384_20610 [Psychrobacillus lasiicapitis]
MAMTTKGYYNEVSALSADVPLTTVLDFVGTGMLKTAFVTSQNSTNLNLRLTIDGNIIYDRNIANFVGFIGLYTSEFSNSNRSFNLPFKESIKLEYYSTQKTSGLYHSIQAVIVHE